MDLLINKMKNGLFKVLFFFIIMVFFLRTLYLFIKLENNILEKSY